MNSYVYILASYKNGTLYIGVTDNLVKGFTEKYSVHDLVYYEIHDDIEQAFLREKQMKKWKRHWKIKLINKSNPNWNDLYDQITG